MNYLSSDKVKMYFLLNFSLFDLICGISKNSMMLPTGALFRGYEYAAGRGCYLEHT